MRPKRALARLMGVFYAERDSLLRRQYASVVILLSVACQRTVIAPVCFFDGSPCVFRPKPATILNKTEIASTRELSAYLNRRSIPRFEYCTLEIGHDSFVQDIGTSSREVAIGQLCTLSASAYALRLFSARARCFLVQARFALTQASAVWQAKDDVRLKTIFLNSAQNKIHAMPAKSAECDVSDTALILSKPLA